jgi:uncharacterized membrane protein YhaH (DUF805 family)
MKHYLNVLKNFNYFNERTGRTEFWSFVLFNIVFAITAFWLDLIFKLNIGSSQFGFLYVGYALLTFIPGIVVGIRRLHDIDKSGWNLLWAFVPLIGGIYLIYLYTKPSDTNQNTWGAVPEKESFINDDATNHKIIIALFSWMIVAKICSLFILKYNVDFYKSPFCLIYTGFVMLVWALFPLFIAMLIKYRNWKIAALICSVLLLFYEFYEYIKVIASQSNYFQF